MKHQIRLNVAAVLTAVAVAVIPAVSPVLAQTPTIFQALDLTVEQQDAIQDVLASRREQVASILTPEQRQQFLQAQQEGKNLRESARTIDNLTEDQESRLREVLQSTRQDIDNILTEEQETELRLLIQENRRDQS